MRYTGYRPAPYRGRRSKQPFFIFLACTLLVLGVFWYFLSDYIIFSADGFEFGSSLERPTEEPPSQEFEKPNYVIEEPTPADPGPTDPMEPTAPEYDPVYLLYPADVTRAAEEGYLSGCIQAARAGGYEAIAMTVRSEEGVLYLPCTSRYAEGSVDPQAQAIAQAVQQASADFPFAAVMPVCRDGKAPRLYREQALRSGTVTWLDSSYLSWFDPYLAGAGDYAAALLQSCSDAGFSAVVLTRVSFPSRGKLEQIDSWNDQTATKQQAVSRLAAALGEKAAALNLQLSLLLESDQAEDVLVTGQSVADLQHYFSCIYLPQGDPTPMANRYKGCLFGTYSAQDGYTPYISESSNVPNP